MNAEEIQELYRKVKQEMTNKMKSGEMNQSAEGNQGNLSTVIIRPIQKPTIQYPSRGCCGRAR